MAASAHLVIDRNGDIIQLVPFNVESWHAGKSFHLGRVNLNHYSIGIELDNLGKLRREGEKFIAECGKEVQPSDVFVDEENGQPTYRHRYTDEQLKNGRSRVPALDGSLPDPLSPTPLGHHSPENRPGPGIPA